MTDKELAQALRQCYGGSGCNACPFERRVGDCAKVNPTLAANLIEAILVENERLKEQIHKDTTEKYAYLVGTIADTESHGIVHLTKQEAEVVAYATNSANWEDIYDEGYSGEFFIDTEHPIALHEGERFVC